MCSSRLHFLPSCVNLWVQCRSFAASQIFDFEGWLSYADFVVQGISLHLILHTGSQVKPRSAERELNNRL